ncbi:MAG: hypothetical protein ABIS08_02030 [Pseudolysinimonas sp.]
MGDATMSDTRGRSVLDDSAGWLSSLASVLAQATRVAVRLRPDGLLELSDRGEVLGYVEFVSPVYVAHVGECPQFAVEVGQRTTLAAAVEDVRRHHSAVFEQR